MKYIALLVALLLLVKASAFADETTNYEECRFDQAVIFEELITGFSAPAEQWRSAANQIRVQIVELVHRLEAIDECLTLFQSDEQRKADFEAEVSMENLADLSVFESCVAVANMVNKSTLVQSMARKYLQDTFFMSTTPRNVSVSTLLFAVKVFEDAAAHYVNYSSWMSKNQAEEEWNRKCIGRFTVGEEHRLVQEFSAIFEPRSNGDLLVFGDIEAGFSVSLKQALDENPNTRLVVFGSAGGNLKEAMLAGRFIRQKGFGTALYADCVSACPLAFLGGRGRTLGIEGSYQLGFHKPYIFAGGQKNPYPAGAEIYDEIEEFVQMMGANGRFVVSAMKQAEPEDMHYPDADELCRYSVATVMYPTFCTRIDETASIASPAPNGAVEQLSKPEIECGFELTGFRKRILNLLVAPENGWSSDMEQLVADLTSSTQSHADFQRCKLDLFDPDYKQSVLSQMGFGDIQLPDQFSRCAAMSILMDQPEVTLGMADLMFHERYGFSSDNQEFPAVALVFLIGEINKVKSLVLMQAFPNPYQFKFPEDWEYECVGKWGN